MINLIVTKKIYWGIFLGLILFLFLAIKFCKTVKTDLIYQDNQNNLVELVRVIDGDTIEVKIEEKIESVRLIGIDAPEMNEYTKEKAIKSKQYLESLLHNQKIFLEKDESQDDRDVYNRLLRYIYLEDNTLINKKMIEADMATEYTFITPYKFQNEFKQAENN